MIFTKIKDVSQYFSKTNVLLKIGAMGLAACFMLTGCSKAEEATPTDEISKQELENQSNKKQTVTGQVSGTESAESEQKKSVNGYTITIKPVSYDVQNWESSNERIEIDDLKQIKSMLGKVTMTDENSLDYASNTATKYRFMKGDQPYLDIIDSDKYLEFGWYYANPGDSDSEKKMSVNHAKKVYKVSTALMGEPGADLVTTILSGQIVKKKDIEEKNVELAKCEFYSCMLILKKEA